MAPTDGVITFEEAHRGEAPGTEELFRKLFDYLKKTVIEEDAVTVTGAYRTVLKSIGIVLFLRKNTCFSSKFWSVSFTWRSAINRIYILRPFTNRSDL